MGTIVSIVPHGNNMKKKSENKHYFTTLFEGELILPYCRWTAISPSTNHTMFSCNEPTIEQRHYVGYSENVESVYLSSLQSYNKEKNCFCKILLNIKQSSWYDDKFRLTVTDENLKSLHSRMVETKQEAIELLQEIQKIPYYIFYFDTLRDVFHFERD